MQNSYIRGWVFGLYARMYARMYGRMCARMYATPPTLTMRRRSSISIASFASCCLEAVAVSAAVVTRASMSATSDNAAESLQAQDMRWIFIGGCRV